MSHSNNWEAHSQQIKHLLTDRKTVPVEHRVFRQSQIKRVVK